MYSNPKHAPLVERRALARLSNHVLLIVALVPGSATSPACVVRTLREVVSHVTLAKIATDGARAHVLSLKVFDEHLPAHVLLHARTVPSFGTAVATAVMYEVMPLRCDGRQNFWRLRRAALSDLDEPKACGTHEHALGGLPTNRYSQFLLRCSRKKPQKFSGACGGLSHSLHSQFGVSGVHAARPSRSHGLHITKIHRGECLRHRTQTRKYVAFLRSATANPKFSAPAAS